ncbi:MAG: hypothetical protein WCP22_00110 [Chlamydiota bacterium]
MKRIPIFLLLFSFAGAVLGWCYALMREPLFLCEATVAVRGTPLREGGIAEIRRQMIEAPVLVEAAHQSGGAQGRLTVEDLSERVYASVIDEGRIRLGYRAGEPGVADAFVRAWVDSFQQGRTRLGDENGRKEVVRLKERLSVEEGLQEKAGDTLKAFLVEKEGLPAQHADRTLARLARGERLPKIVGEETARLDKESAETEGKLRELTSKEKILAKSLEGEQQYVVTYQMKEENPVVRELQQKLAEKQMELHRLSVDSTNKHPLRARYEQEVEQIKGLLRDKPLETVKEERREMNPVYKDIALDLSKTKREIAALSDHAAYLRESRAAAVKIAALVVSDEDRAGSFVGEYQARQKAVDNARAVIEEAQAKFSPGARSVGMEIVDIAAPSIPLSQGPRMRMLIAAGAIGGAVVGLLAWGTTLLVRGPVSRKSS